MAIPSPTELRADCSRCVGLCCMALAFPKSADFAVDKAAGDPCHNLLDDDRCGIHERLRPAGFPGCIAFDCSGAGQRVVQITFAGQSWRDSPKVAAEMSAVFHVVRLLHELLVYLTEARDLPGTEPLRADIDAAIEKTDSLAGQGPDEIGALNVKEYQHRTAELLLAASELARAGTDGANHRWADLTGADLRGADLVGACLRSTKLIGTDLRDADLRLADVTGADMRGADVSGADLSTTLFLVDPQLAAMRGDARTILSPTHARPTHWS